MSKNRPETSETPLSKSTVGSIPALSTLESVKLASKGAFFVLEEKTVPKDDLSENVFRKRFLKERTPYKLPKIIRNKGGDWYIKYWYEYPGKGTYKEFRVRDGINYIHDPDKKEKAALELCGDIKYALEKKGHNPFERKIQKHKKIDDALAQIEKANQVMTLGAALMWYISTKKGKGKSDKTLMGYRHSVQWFIDWYGAREVRINEVTIDDIERYLSSRLDSEDWSPRTYNNNIGALTTFFNYLVSKRKLAVNPIGRGMLETIKNTAEKNRYYDEATLARIMPLVKKKANLRRYMLWTYYSCARGSELRSLKIKHLDLTIKKISIMAEHGKTGEHVGKRSIPICEELMEIINEDKLQTLNPEWYVFGNRGIPGELQADENYFSALYYPIKIKLGLDFRWSIYGLKHSRVINLLISGFEPIKVMYLTGHTDWGSFQKYIRELGAVMDVKMTGKTEKLKL